jgi:Uma2 family endonuclease
MSIVTAPTSEQRFVWYDLSWNQYEQLLRALGDRRLRHTYVEGSLEIVTPSMDHEATKSVLGIFVATLCRVLKLPRKSIGSTTIKKEGWRRGLEPDECFYLGEPSVKRMKSKRRLNPDRDPPPELIVEVDITSSSDDRIEFYQRLGVAEVWRYSGEVVEILTLAKPQNYRMVKRSRLFPFLTADDLSRFLSRRNSIDDTQLETEFEDWVRQQVAKQNAP